MARTTATVPDAGYEITVDNPRGVPVEVTVTFIATNCVIPLEPNFTG